MFCGNCGREINDNSVVCPYCGVSLAPIALITQPTKKSVNAFGIAGFIVSLLSLWLGMYFCIASIVAVVLSSIGLAVKNKHSVNGLAVAGLVIGIVTLVIWGLVWIIVGAAIISFA